MNKTIINITNELLKFNNNFTGIVKFGIEKGNIVSEVIKSEGVANIGEIKNVIKQDTFDFITSDFYGNVEIFMIKGVAYKVNYQQTFQGYSLIKRLENAKVPAM